MLEQELFELLEGSADAAFTVTEQGEICSWNNAAERIFGFRKDRLSRNAAKVFCRVGDPWAPKFGATIAV